MYKIVRVGAGEEIKATLAMFRTGEQCVAWIAKHARHMKDVDIIQPNGRYYSWRLPN